MCSRSLFYVSLSRCTKYFFGRHSLGFKTMDELTIVFEFFNELMGLSYGSRYVPVPLPVSLTRAELRVISEAPTDFLCSHKNDGERCMLLIGNHELLNFWALVSRTGALLESHFYPPETSDGNLYEGTLLDGEMLLEKFVVFDAVSVCGYDYKPLPFFQRLQVVEKYIRKINQTLPSLTFRVDTKTWVHASRISSLWSPRQTVNVGKVDGIILADKHQPYGRNRTKSFQKWKALHTVDIRIQGPSRIMVQTSRGKEEELRDEISVSVINYDAKTHKNRICECEIVSIQSRTPIHFVCKVLCVRQDKVQANHLSTVHRIVQSASENITLTDLCRMDNNKCA